ncbi:MAG: hypothetical protein ACYCX4_01315 [Bacillota bacterium]
MRRMLAYSGNAAAHAYVGLFVASFVLQGLAALALLVIGFMGIGHLF